MQEEKNEQLPCLPYSPEHAWDALDYAIRQREVQPTNLRGELSDALTQEWVRCTEPEIPIQAS